MLENELRYNLQALLPSKGMELFQVKLLKFEPTLPLNFTIKLRAPYFLHVIIT